MSRIGKLPIEIPSGVTITVDPELITVSGTKGTLSQSQLDGITVKVEDGVCTVSRINDEPKNRAKHGLMRSLIQNMVEGVSTGFSKQLELNGVGYRVALAGNGLKMSLGFSHEVNFPMPTGVTATVEQNLITVSGFDKQLVGQVAADIRKLKKPEPYKGKGIKYVGERILRKSGKSGKEK
jgi:large subunit ribosomal protein L6